jgi:hypothetical protein
MSWPMRYISIAARIGPHRPSGLSEFLLRAGERSPFQKHLLWYSEKLPASSSLAQSFTSLRFVGFWNTASGGAFRTPNRRRLLGGEERIIPHEINGPRSTSGALARCNWTPFGDGITLTGRE